MTAAQVADKLLASSRTWCTRSPSWPINVELRQIAGGSAWVRLTVAPELWCPQE